jgi:hypothetical protein
MAIIMMVKIAIQCIKMKMEKYIKQKIKNKMKTQSVHELASELYFYFIEFHGIRDKCVIEKEDYSENTDFGRELYYQIEDKLMNIIRKPPLN